ncbi:hypothetical protein MRX96_008493 [Rhipicephalus microplus]
MLLATSTVYSLDLDSSLANALAAAPHTAPREKLRMAVLLSLSIVRTPGERAAKAIAIYSAWLALRVRTLHDGKEIERYSRQLCAQQWRLLERVGLSSPEEQDHETSPLTESTMRRLVVYPLPKNMGPGESEGRRAARARALLLQHQNDEGAVYVDVAKVKNKDAYVAAANPAVKEQPRYLFIERRQLSPRSILEVQTRVQIGVVASL